MMQSTVRPSGELALKVTRGAAALPPALSALAREGSQQAPTNRPLTFWEILAFGLPAWGLSPAVNLWRLRNLPNLWRGVWRILAARFIGLPHFYGVLLLTVLRGDGTREYLGLASLRVVTTAGVTDVCTRFAGTSAANIANYKYHGFGTGTNAESSGDTALQTELTTQYAVDSTRPTGSQVASTNTYTSVATLSPDSGGTLAITEHGLFSAASSITLLDRTVFSAVNLVAGSDSLQATYVLTLAAGG
jgi:hypothetical protein